MNFAKEWLANFVSQVLIKRIVANAAHVMVAYAAAHSLKLPGQEAEWVVFFGSVIEAARHYAAEQYPDSEAAKWL